jgi:hypothetical protein
MQIFEIAAKKPIQEAINPGAVIGALGSKLAAYNAQQAGLSMPNDADSGSAYGDMRAKAAAAADPLINQMAADELANWNQSLSNAMKSSGARSPGALPPRVKQGLSNSFMNRVYGFFLDNQLGNDFSQFPRYVDNKSQSEASILLSELRSSIQSILNYNSPPSTPQGQFQQWRNLSKATYDMRSLMQFNSAKNRAPAAAKKMPIIMLDPSGKFKIGSTTLNYRSPVHANIHSLMMSMMPTPTSTEPTIAMSPSGDVLLDGHLLDPRDPVEGELIKIIAAQIKKLNP